MKPVLASVAAQAVHLTDPGGVMQPESIRARAFKPPVLVLLFIGAAIVGAALPLFVSYAPVGHRAIERQVDGEHNSLCEQFELSGTMQHTECKAALADLRHRRELLVLH